MCKAYRKAKKRPKLGTIINLFVIWGRFSIDFDCELLKRFAMLRGLIFYILMHFGHLTERPITRPKIKKSLKKFYILFRCGEKCYAILISMISEVWTIWTPPEAVKKIRGCFWTFLWLLNFGILWKRPFYTFVYHFIRPYINQLPRIKLSPWIQNSGLASQLS